MNKAVVVAACRTPIGKIPGPFTKYDEVSLLSVCYKEVVKRAGINPEIIDNSYAGCAFQTEKVNIGRKAISKAGLPGTIPGTTINRSCISSMEALVQAVHDIMVGSSDTVLAGGVEVVSNSPYLINFYRKMAKLPKENDALKPKGDFTVEQMKNYQNVPDYDTEVQEIDENEVQLISESYAKKFNVSRDELDEYAYDSMTKACNAAKNGYFMDEIVPVEAELKGEKYFVSEDQLLHPELTLAELKAQKTFYVKDGIMTAINAPSLADCACAMLLMSEAKAKELGVTPLAEICADSKVGMEKEQLGQAIGCAVKDLLSKTKLQKEEIDLWEINETFGPQMIEMKRDMKIPSEIFNVNGGCIALGHPVGASGLRICITLIYEMIRRDAKKGVVAGCAGAGMGQSILFCRE